jgi:hypothetical protein
VTWTSSLGWSQLELFKLGGSRLHKGLSFLYFAWREVSSYLFFFSFSLFAYINLVILLFKERKRREA